MKRTQALEPEFLYLASGVPHFAELVLSLFLETKNYEYLRLQLDTIDNWGKLCPFVGSIHSTYKGKLTEVGYVHSQVERQDNTPTTLSTVRHLSPNPFPTQQKNQPYRRDPLVYQKTIEQNFESMGTFGQWAPFEELNPSPPTTTATNKIYASAASPPQIRAHPTPEMERRNLHHEEKKDLADPQLPQPPLSTLEQHVTLAGSPASTPTTHISTVETHLAVMQLVFEFTDAYVFHFWPFSPLSPAGTRSPTLFL